MNTDYSRQTPFRSIPFQAIPPDQTYNLVNDILDEHRHRENTNRRICDRHAIVLPITIQFLDHKRQPIGEPISAISQNLSMSGIGLLTQSSTNAPLALIRFDDYPGPHQELLIEIRHVGSIGPFYTVGGRFLVQWRKTENCQ